MVKASILEDISPVHWELEEVNVISLWISIYSY